MEFGHLRHRVTLDNPSAPIPDGDGGESIRWPPAGGVRVGTRVPAAVDTVVGAGQERTIAKTVEGVGSYTVQLRYLAGVTLQTRVTFHDGLIDRVLWVNGIADDQQRHAMLVLSCAERVA